MSTINIYSRQTKTLPFGLIKSIHFYEGQIICHSNNWKQGRMVFMRASQDDVNGWSGRNGDYIIIVDESLNQLYERNYNLFVNYILSMYFKTLS